MKIGQFHFFQHHLTTFTFMPSLHSYDGFNWEAVTVKIGHTAIPTLNGRISKMKRDFLNPLVPKFSYDRGLSPTHSWKWPNATLSPSFGHFQSEKIHAFRGVPEGTRGHSLVRICPRDPFCWRKKEIYSSSKNEPGTVNFVNSFIEVFSLIFTQPAWKHYIYCPPSPPIQPNHPPHAPPPQNNHVTPNKW